AAIPVATRADGSSLAIGDIAAVRDGFAEVDIASRFDGRPAVLVQVFRVGDQNALDLAAAVRDYVAGAQARLPAGVSLTVWNDTSLFLSGRISLLLTNAAQGFFLVFLVLALFLRFKLAWWVSIGIPVSFLGALCFLPLLDVSINMISLFAFILVLGIVVDDAIVVGENIHHHRSLGLGSAEAARRGVREVALPVAVAVMTAVISFLPMMNVPGFMGKIWRVIPVVCIATLLFSLVETQLALPSHLAHEGGLLERVGAWLTRPLRPLLPLWTGLQGACARGLDRFVARIYVPLLDRCLAWRYATFAVFVAAMILTVGLIAGGRLRFTYFPSVEGDIVAADVVLPPGATAAQTADAVGRLEAAAIRLRAELEESAGEPIVDHLLASVGTQPYRGMVGGPGAGATSGSGVGEVMLALVPSERRSMPTHEVQRRWRELVGELPGVSELAYSADIASAGNAVEVRFAGDDLVALGDIAEDLRAELETFTGVYNITDDHRQGKDELVLRLSPAAETLGIGQLDLARQLRQAFYGEEAQRVQRGRDDIKVMVRYPEAERATVGDLDSFRVRADDGRELPLRSVAEVEAGAGYSRISRSDRKRTVTVSASLDPAVANGNEVNARLAADTLPTVLRDHPGTTWSMEGEAREQRESMSGLASGYLLSLLVIYVMIAVSFSSYVQPLIIMGAIPFGIVGAALGHLIMGLDLSILSVCGIVALAGIEVNDSIVLVEFINRARAAGMPIQQALREAGPRRFRPIFLTSATTFIGLLPVIVSGQLSVQAKFLVPMAVSLGFGGVFSTAITLLLVPCAYAVIEDLKGNRPEVRKSGSPEVS
nr:efflux RND transporter permease subunit [Planctomycetota bacterium]